MRIRPSHLALLLAAALVVVTGCNRGGSQAQAGQPPPAMPVKIVTIQPAPVKDVSEYVATLRSRHSTTLRPQVEGQITQIYVKSGERVAAGDPLMQIDPLKQAASVVSQEAQHEAKKAAVRYAQQQLDRIRQLHEEGVASKQDLDAAQTSYDSAVAELKALEAQLKEQQVQLQYYKVLAPTAGIVGDIPVHVGDRVNNETMLTTVDRPGPLEAYVDVPVERARSLALKRPVELTDSQGTLLAQGSISFISPRVNEEAQTVLVKAEVDNRQGTLRTDQFTRARIIFGSQPGILVPVLSVARISGQAFVFVAEGDQKSLVARQRRVQLGEIVGNDYVVLEGLKSGDRLILSGLQNLADGMAVRPEG
ncbi:MAG: efflux RND transporter periplasmic adaptor subunit [Acidobacteriales bacterium]|nr:efflux RND transporter periplasmic adaptor subunit [Terriglobales bacterium]